MRRAKILATMGPASREPAIIEALIAAGVNGIRINMSHGNQEEKAEDIRMVRAVAERMSRPVAVLVDLSGPKLRTTVLKGGRSVALETNALFTVTTRTVAGDSKEVSTNYSGLPRDVRPGKRILLDDGLIELSVERVTDTDVICRIINGGMLGERKGINLPGISLPIPSLTDKDRSDLEWAVRHGADYIALSFVRRAQDCLDAQLLIKSAGGAVPLIAKIEKAEAIDHLDEIVATADGVMVARGDLGVETSVEMVPVYQKRIIEQANIAGKIVITATQMLQSMIENPRPTRAEASDVANAVWDGTDCVMLSNETAMGKYPVVSVSTMARVIQSAESGRPSASNARQAWAGKQSKRISRALCEAAAYAAEEMSTKTIAVFTESGLMARRLAAIRPGQRIIALTPSRDVRNQLALIWGIESALHPPSDVTEDLIMAGDRILQQAGITQQGELIVLMAGVLSGLGMSRTVKFHTTGENELH